MTDREKAAQSVHATYERGELETFAQAVGIPEGVLFEFCTAFPAERAALSDEQIAVILARAPVGG